MTTTRGIRNNNPGNIDRKAANKWQGRMPAEKMTDAQRAEKRFEVFAAPAWGIRAMAVLLINYFDRHGCDTVEKIINRWAPPVENDTGAYVRAVASAVGVAPTARISLHDYARLRPLVVAIIAHENAGYAYPAEIVDEGLRLAGVVKPKASLAQNAAATALVAGGTAAAIEVVPPVLDGIAQVLPLLSTLGQVANATTGLPQAARVVAYVLVGISICASLYAWYRLRRAQKSVAP